jgi:uncharacterized protein
MKRMPSRLPSRRIPLRAIHKVAQSIANQFRPDQIILFGSYAYGKPTPESDVDLLIVMETTLREKQQRLEISRAISPRSFPLDVVVRTPQQLHDRISMGDAFLAEIVSRGKRLYERHR